MLGTKTRTTEASDFVYFIESDLYRVCRERDGLESFFF